MKQTGIFFILMFLLCIARAQYDETCLTHHDSENRYASYSPDGLKILFESNRSGYWDIFLMDPDGANPALIKTSSKNSRRPSWHPSGNSIVYENVDSNELIELNLINGNERILMDEKTLNNNVIYGKMHFPRYNPKGTQLSFSIQESDTVINLMIMDLKTGAFEEVFLINSEQPTAIGVQKVIGSFSTQGMKPKTRPTISTRSI